MRASLAPTDSARHSLTTRWRARRGRLRRSIIPTSSSFMKLAMAAPRVPEVQSTQTAGPASCHFTEQLQVSYSSAPCDCSATTMAWKLPGVAGKKSPARSRIQRYFANRSAHFLRFWLRNANRLRPAKAATCTTNEERSDRQVLHLFWDYLRDFYIRLVNLNGSEPGNEAG